MKNRKRSVETVWVRYACGDRLEVPVLKAEHPEGWKTWAARLEQEPCREHRQSRKEVTWGHPRREAERLPGEAVMRA